MKFITTILFTVLLFVFSCTEKTIQKDDEISEDLLQSLTNLNTQIIEGFNKEDINKVISFFSENLKKRNGEGMKKFVPQVSKHFDNSKYVIKNQLYIKELELNKDKIVKVQGEDENHDYSVSFVPVTEEVFINVGYFKSNLREMALVTIFGRYEGEWKLNILKVGDYTYGKKDAYDWYISAKRNFESGSLIDAANDISLAKQCLSPAGTFLVYKKDIEISSYYTKVMDEVNNKFTFPVVVDNIPSKPSIFKIFPKGERDGYFPMIMYFTSIKMIPENKDKIKDEGENLHNSIGDIFEGLNQNKKKIFYQAFEKGVKEGDEIKEYSFIKEIN